MCDNTVPVVPVRTYRTHRAEPTVSPRAVVTIAVGVLLVWVACLGCAIIGVVRALGLTP